MKKRGQVTIFVILALMILFLIGIAYFIKEIVVEQSLFNEIREPAIIPGQIQSINFYVDECIDNVALEGISLVGMQGGYVEVPSDKIPISPANQFSNGVSLPGVKIAYWHYEDFSGQIKEEVPSLKFIEDEIGNYIESNLEGCIADFKFLDDNFEIDTGNVVSQVDIKEDEIFVKVRYPLNIEKDGSTYSLNDHVQQYPIKLGRMYEQAIEIINKENEILWLENKSLDLIYLDDERIPGVVLDFGCGPLLYSEREIAENFKKSLEINVPLYYIKDSNNIVSGEFDELRWEVEDVDKELSVDFLYNTDWPISLDVKPSKGDVILIEPFEGDIVFGSLCVNYEQLFYDVKHPIVVSVEDDSGYNFQYGIMVILRGNEARGENVVHQSEKVGYCDLREKQVDVYVEGVDESGSVNPLDGSDVFYRCVSNNCYIGRTDENGYVRGNFPVCGNGEVNVKKGNYVEDSVSLTTFDGGALRVDLSLESFIEKNVRFKVYDLVNGNLIGPRELKEDEKVIFQVSYEINGQSVYGDVGISGEKEIINLVPKSFYLKGSLIKTSPSFIEGQTITRCKGPKILGVCTAGEETVQIPSETVEEVILGGVEMDWKVNVNELYSSESVEVYVINKGTPSKMEDLNFNLDVLRLTEGHEGEVIPKFV